MAARLRQAVKRGGRIALLHGADDELLMPVAARCILAPSRWESMLAEILVALLRSSGSAVPAQLASVEPSEHARAIAAELSSGERKAILLGLGVSHHPAQARLLRLVQAIGQACGATVGHLGESANAVGAWLAGAVPSGGGADAGAVSIDRRPDAGGGSASRGLDARAMVEAPRALYLLLNNEPSLDHGLPVAARAAMAAADSVIALTAYRSEELLELADCLLPIAPYTETAGSFVNAEGRLQSFTAVVRPAGECRPAWKVLRVLGDLTGVAGMAFDSAEAVRAAALPDGWSDRLDNRIAGDLAVPVAQFAQGLERLADVPIYFTDPIVRRAPSLQATRDARPPTARINARTLEAAGLQPSSTVRVDQTHSSVTGSVELVIELDEGVADGVIRIAAAHPSTTGLPSASGMVSVSSGMAFAEGGR